MQGEFDDKFEWPFWADIHVRLLSWEEGEEDLKELHTRVIPFDESAQECTAACRVVGGDRAEIGHGLCIFASHQDVRAKYTCLKIYVYFSQGTQL